MKITLKTSQINKLIKEWLSEGVSQAEVLNRLSLVDGTQQDKELFVKLYMPNLSITCSQLCS